MTKKEDKKLVEQGAEERGSNVIELSGEEFFLTMPKGRKGKNGVIEAQKPFENLMTNIKAAEGSEAALMIAARELFEQEGFQDEVLPFIVMNSTRGMTKKEALDFWDENDDSIVHVMFQYAKAMFFFLTGSNPEALEEAMGK